MGSGQAGLPLKIRLFVYLSHALSTWGDRMWSFGVGLFMVIISPESLRVTAVYGLSVGSAVLLFGALVGDWIDRTPRLKAARTSLVVQNTSVIVCALIVYTVITYKTQIQAIWPDEALLVMCYVAIILVAIFSMLGSMGTSIAVQKDWIVEICGRDTDLLATTTATLRRIDLCTKLLAPIATGQIMHFASPGIGALFIAGWNLVSVFVEYILLWKVYILVPELRNKKLKKEKVDEKDEAAQEMVTLNDNQGNDLETEGQGHVANSDKVIENTELNDSCSASGKAVETAEVERKMKKEKKKHPVIYKMFSGLIILYRGWKTYIKYDVAFAGLGLAALYMTVLGFDNITVGFAYTQGINESVMGIVMAASALMGILGTFLYPLIRRHIGLERTGLFGFFFEVMFLCLCVASIWAPGSPFDPLHRGHDNAASSDIECSLTHDNFTVNLNGTSAGAVYNVTDAGFNNASFMVNDTDSSIIDEGINNVTSQAMMAGDEHSYISIWLLLAGIVGARCGLWMADLTITQLFLENVKETERGIVNGVQTSLNKLMDMLKFVMVIVAPEPEVFGILILISFTFIILGWISYAKYSRGVRGHLFHFEKIRKCECGANNNNNGDIVVE